MQGIGFCSWVGVATLALSTTAFGAEPAQPGLVDSIKSVHGITVDHIVTLDVDLTANRAMQVVVPVDGFDSTLDLRPHSIRAEGYQLLVQGEDGRLIPTEPGPINTLRGELAEVPGSLVAASVGADGFHAMIIMPEGDRYFVEPVNQDLPGAQVNDYMIYHTDNVELAEGFGCGTVSEIVPGDVDLDFEGSIAAGAPCIAELGCDADFEYFSTYGTVPNTEARINSVINTVNLQYEAQVGITHMISGIIVRAAEPDPYTQFNSTDLLCEFITEWTNNVSISRDVAHLFTGREVNGGTIGQAADIGVTGICVSQGSCVGGQFGTQGSYCFSQSDFNGDFGCATDLTAHELGHLWGAFHCSCPSNTMNPFITCANNFSAATINSIIAYRDTRTCLEGECATGDPTGACCFKDFSCLDGLTASECVAQGGSYQGDFSNCASVDCGGPGGCGDPNAGDCFIPNGTPFCDDFDCCTLICNADPFCCDTEWDGICADAAIAQCGQTPTGACCFSDGTCIDGITAGECDTQGGSYQGDGTDCASVKCIPTGACCFNDGTCVDGFTAGNCIGQGGTYQGDGTDCASVVCVAIGACCLMDGSCVDGQTAGDCAAQGGTYQGDGTDCASVNCPQPPEKCLGDFDNDGVVGVSDLLFLLAAWGPCTECADPFACGDSPVPFCDPASDCVCWTAPDGSGVCGINTTCSTQPLCPAGDDCPPGFVCSVADCCGVNTCWAACDAPGAMQPELQFGDLTGLGIAGIDFEIGNPTQANDNPDCPGDFDFDNVVGVSDLLTLLAAWGPCPGGQCDTPFACGDTPVPFCDPASDCVCWTAADGSGVCGINTTCSTQPLCPAGDDCPPGFVCSVADCCGVNTCWAACDAPGAMQPELQFGDLTGLGIAGVDFEITSN